MPKLEIIRVFGGTINKYGYLDQSVHGICLTVDDLTRKKSICSLTGKQSKIQKQHSIFFLKMTVLVILFNDLFPTNEDEISKTERGFSS